MKSVDELISGVALNELEEQQIHDELITRTPDEILEMLGTVRGEDAKIRLIERHHKGDLSEEDLRSLLVRTIIHLGDAQ